MKANQHFRQTLNSYSDTGDKTAAYPNSNNNCGAQISLQVPAIYISSSQAPSSMGAANAYTINKPPTMAVGDLLLVSLLIVDDGNSAAVGITPSGLTLAYRGTDQRWDWYLYTRVVTGAEPASWDWTFANPWWTSITASVYRGPTSVGNISWQAESSFIGSGPTGTISTAPTIRAPNGSTVICMFADGIWTTATTPIIPVQSGINVRLVSANGYSAHEITDFIV